MEELSIFVKAVTAPMSNRYTATTVNHAMSIECAA